MVFFTIKWISLSLLEPYYPTPYCRSINLFIPENPICISELKIASKHQTSCCKEKSIRNTCIYHIKIIIFRNLGQIQAREREPERVKEFFRHNPIFFSLQSIERKLCPCASKFILFTFVVHMGLEKSRYMCFCKKNRNMNN